MQCVRCMGKPVGNSLWICDVQIGMSREAPAMFKHGGVYFMLTSACTGWNPNRAEVFYARCGANPKPNTLNPDTLKNQNPDTPRLMR